LPGGENVLERSESWNCFLFFPVTVLNCVAAPGMVSNQFRIFVARFYPRVILGRRVDINRVRALLGARANNKLEFYLQSAINQVRVIVETRQ
jgi:hypothetical protein